MHKSTFLDSLDGGSVRVLMQAFARVHSVVEVSAFPSALFSALNCLVPGVTVSFDLLDPATGVVTSVTSENLLSDELKPRVLELMPTHPVTEAHQARHRGDARATDCASQQLRRETHHLKTSPISIRHKMIALDLPGTSTAMTMKRGTVLTDTEATLLRLAAPQIALAYRNAQAFTALKRAAAQAIPTPKELQKVGVTAREAQVLHWVIQGKRDAEIATILTTSSRTINNHLRSILLKLGAETRTAAARSAIESLQDQALRHP